jgi:flagellar FliJ protein
MATFTFRLEQVLRYRKQLEEQAMQMLAQAVGRRDATLARIAVLSAGIAEQRALLCRAESLSPAEFWLARIYESALKADLADAKELLVEQENEVDQRRIELVQKAQDRKLLDKLKDKQAVRFALEERKQEQKINDETATLRYKPAAF